MSEQNPEEEARKKATRDKLDREMEALGYNPDSPSQLAEFQKLQDKLAAGRITQQEALRGMDQAVYLEREKEIRETAKQQQRPDPQQLANDAEAKRVAYSNELEDDKRAGRINETEGLQLEGRFEGQLAMDLKAPDSTVIREIPTPDREQSPQRPFEADDRQQEHKQFVKRPMDWERMVSDPSYRKQMEQQAREERAFRLEQERASGRTRPDSGGRER